MGNFRGWLAYVASQVPEPVGIALCVITFLALVVVAYALFRTIKNR